MAMATSKVTSTGTVISWACLPTPIESFFSCEGKRRLRLNLEKADLWWFAHSLSWKQMKLSRRLPPAVRLFRLAEKNLASFTPVYHGLDVAALCRLLRGYADEIAASDYNVNPWSPETAPKLKLG